MKRNRDTVLRPFSCRLVHHQCRHVREGFIQGKQSTADVAYPDRIEGFIDRTRLRNVKRPYSPSLELKKMSSDSKHLADIRTQRSNVRSL
jgi:hypothetical protein